LGIEYVFTSHAESVVQKRAIPNDWIERALLNPKVIQPDLLDPDLEHRLILIPEHENRVLRVIVNAQVKPIRIVTVYFDRGMRGKL